VKSYDSGRVKIFGCKDTPKTGKKSNFVRFRESNKLNTLHLHLDDDQGWRVEIKSRQPARTPEELEAYLALPSDRDW